MKAARSARDERGFVLVGVVIFVLALTIIGLSLFSVSSYETQFLQRSMDSEQAYHAAMGGLERAKFVLAATSRLERVGQGLPVENVVSAEAIQGAASAGDVHWTPHEPITLRVTALVHDARRTVEARFVPELSRSPYTYLFSVSGHVAVDAAWPPGAGALDRRFTNGLFGSVWEAGTPVDTSWAAPLTTILAQPPAPGIRTAPLTCPDLSAYFAAHFADAERVEPIQHGANPPEYRLWSSQANASWYRLRDDDSYVPFPYVAGEPAPEFHVQGLAVLEFPHGVRFEPLFRVTGTGGGINDVLVVVAGRIGTAPVGDEDDERMGFRAFGGIQVDDNVTLIIVSDGNVYLQHGNNPSQVDSRVADLTVYAANLRLTGPQRPPAAGEPQRSMTLGHTGVIEVAGGGLQRLAADGALPGVNSIVDHQFAFVPGTWRSPGDAWRSVDR